MAAARSTTLRVRRLAGVRARRGMEAAAALCAALAFGACSSPSSGASGDSDTPPRIRLSSPASTARSGTIDLLGLPAADLSALQAAHLTTAEWNALLRVSVGTSGPHAADLPAVLGTYRVTDDIVRFTPAYGFDPGRRYRVSFDPLQLPSRKGAANATWRSHPIEVTVGEAGVDAEPTTRVVRVYPTAAEIPENQLRMYVSFSAPMGLRGGVDHIRLLDSVGHEVEGAFLPLETGLWNADRTRYTLLFDPGRVKRGIPPNERMGRPLSAGSTYTLVIDRDWRDAGGRPLATAFGRQFHVGPAASDAIDPGKWRLAAPDSGTRDPLVVSFPGPLDYALLQKALVVTTGSGGLVSGEIAIEAAETRWVFTPHEPWSDAAYRLVALTVLEDPAGNRVGRPFEVALSDEATLTGKADAVSLPFGVRSNRH